MTSKRREKPSPTNISKTKRKRPSPSCLGGDRTKKQIDTAFNYQKIDDETTAQSVELQATLKNEGLYSMTEGERLCLIDQTSYNPLNLMELRAEAN